MKIGEIHGTRSQHDRRRYVFDMFPDGPVYVEGHVVDRAKLRNVSIEEIEAMLKEAAEKWLSKIVGDIEGNIVIKRGIRSKEGRWLCSGVGLGISKILRPDGSIFYKVATVHPSFYISPKDNRLVLLISCDFEKSKELDENTAAEDEAKLIKVIRKDPQKITKLSSPSEAVQLAAVDADPMIIHHLYYAPFSVQRHAVLKDPELLDVVPNPSPQLWDDQLIKTAYLRYIVDLIKNPGKGGRPLYYMSKLIRSGCRWPELKRLIDYLTKMPA